MRQTKTAGVTLALLVSLVSGSLVAPAGAITGGRLATRDYPHMAALYRDGGFICGASLVAPEWILTAAHCVEGGSAAQFTFVLGRQNLNNSGGETLRAISLVIHESYGRPKSSSHDIALLKLERASAYAPIKIANPATDKPLWAPGKTATVIGYGAEAYPGVYSDGRLREVEVPMVSDADCARSYTVSGGFESQTMVCAGELQGAKDSCQGDSGGPLMVPDTSGNFVQTGAVSWGFGCGYPTQYGVYARVGDSTLYDWIHARIGQSGPGSPPPPGSSAPPTAGPATTPASGGPSSPASGSVATTTIRSSTARSPFLGGFRLSGSVTTPSGCGAPNTHTVSISRRTFGSNSYEVIASDIPVSAEGAWSFDHAAPSSASYVATVSPSDTCTGETSSPVDVAVKVKITVEARDRCRSPQAIRGRVEPNHAGTDIVLQIRRNRWRTVDRDELNTGSRFQLVARRCGKTYRVVWPKQAASNDKAARTFSL